MRIRRQSWKKCNPITYSLPFVGFVLHGNCCLRDTQPETDIQADAWALGLEEKGERRERGGTGSTTGTGTATPALKT